MDFSAHSRSAIKEKLKTHHFDVLVIGGGITGCGIALDAASRGLKTALVEKNDFAYGTSSRSTKLIHGGLRYLKQLEFALVKEVGSERAIVHRLAPHLVVPEKMLLPLYEKRGLGYWLTSVGLKIYDWLAGVKPEDQRRMLTKLQTIKYEPLLKNDDIKGGAIYAEYRTDDARLTIEIAKKAHFQGAMLLNYIHVKDFRYTNENISGVKVHDEIAEDDFEIKSAVVINAAGPWVDELREINKSKENKQLHLTKGVHIVLPYHRLPVRQAIYFDVPDGRMIFAIPRGRITYVGTTDTDYQGDKDHVVTSKEDARYLVDAINETFPSARITMADIESSWAGLRPLIHEAGKSASELSRKDEIFESATGLYSIAGGKLTGYRKMAERVLDLVIKKNFGDRDLANCTTDSIPLATGAFNSIKEVETYSQQVARQISELGLKGEMSGYLVHLFGKQTDAIIKYIRSRSESDPEVSLALAELDFALQNEMVIKADDFFIRRTGMLYFDLPRMQKVIPALMTELKNRFQWDDQRLDSEMLTIKNRIADASLVVI
ncbi:MAG: glycerol-3-phosphate dehydrogenase/oxidase, partial [Cyclobacteriaceae bacterium]|nr:glycerol-3-phosphate dehydrogenase/oxidase [Cyclobacteriaceae bacterium]